MSETFQITAKCMAGMEPVLVNELIALGAKDVIPQTRAVFFSGNTELLYKANLHLRTALRILKPIDSFYAHDFGRLYKRIKRIEWSDYFSEIQSFAIDSVTFGKYFKHSHFTSLKVKDAIVDYFREKTGNRPSVDTDNPDVLISIHIVDRQCTISLDSSGKPLDKRGYKQENTDAPISEVLAAGLILNTGWKADTNFFDPMCGSGTIAIEAALIAGNIAPGKYRKFAFQNWPDFDASLWEKLMQNAIQQEKKIDIKIAASDIHMQVAEIAAKNIQSAGLSSVVEVKNMDFMQSRASADKGIIVMNPPYGERLDKDKDMDVFYHRIGDHLKQYYSGWDAWIFSGNKSAIKLVGLKPSKKLAFLNGAIECKFHKFELYKGSKS
jgi:putative N6-adenine-specific DNA methylase